MFRNVVVCFAAVLALLVSAPVENNDGGQLNSTTNVAQAKGTSIWFFSRSGIDYWLTKANYEGDNVYTVSVTATANGQFHQMYVYKVKSENGVAYTSTYDKMSGTWESWYHDDFAQALWQAVKDNY